MIANNSNRSSTTMKNEEKTSFFGRRRGKRSNRLGNFSKTVAREWKASISNNGDEKYTIKTPDGRFELVISQEDNYLCINSCLLHCRSEQHSSMVMRKALELNYLTRKRLGFTLAIDPSSKAKSHPQTVVALVDLTLCYSKSFVGVRLDRFRREVKDFVEVAFNVQSQLEATDEGRLGASPRSDGLIDYGIEALQRPESRAPMALARQPTRKPSPPPSPVPSRPTRSSSLKEDILAGKLPLRLQSVVPATSKNTAPSQPIRANSITTVSTKCFKKKKIMEQFDDPAEAKLYETFMRNKARYIKQAEDLKKSLSQDEDDNENKVFCDDSDDEDSVVTITGPAAKLAFNFPQPAFGPEDDGKTPIISNRKGSDDEFHIVESENRAVC
jgi:hypothetical protein